MQQKQEFDLTRSHSSHHFEETQKLQAFGLVAMEAQLRGIPVATRRILGPIGPNDASPRS